MKTIPPLKTSYRLAGFCLATLLLSGCAAMGGSVEPPWVAAVAGDAEGDLSRVQTDNAIVENLPKSLRGNPPVYRVFGESYRVLDSAEEFQEWGVASWYGTKFHGRETSSGEIYDMYQMTAAHKHLPIPTFVRVTRVDSGKSIVVKVNDRGPFVGDRIIDLSYAAAVELDMVNSGKMDVYIEALSTHHVIEPLLTEPLDYDVDQMAALKSAEPLDVGVQELVNNDVFIQVGAFSQAPNAAKLADKVRGTLSFPVGVNHDSNRRLHLVQIGPMSNEAMVEDAIASLSIAGIDSFTFVTANP